MSLTELNKAERRTRILDAATRLIGERGFDQLTMRDLAVASRVSVPTIYNLIGGKRAVLMELLAELFTRVTGRLAEVTEGDFVDRAMAYCSAAWEELCEGPSYCRALTRMFLTASDKDDLRRQTDGAYIGVMAELLREAQADGDIEAWVDVNKLSASMYTQYTLAMIRWAKDELDAAGMESSIRYGIGLLLLGVTTTPAIRDHLHQMITDNQERAHAEPLQHEELTS